MRNDMSENKKCERCQDYILNDNNECLNCKRINQVHEDVQSFIKKLQEAQEATRKHNTYFGPLPEHLKPKTKETKMTFEELVKAVKKYQPTDISNETTMDITTNLIWQVYISKQKLGSSKAEILELISDGLNIVELLASKLD